MQDLPNYSQLDQRAAYFYAVLLVTKGMLSQTPGAGQAYLGSFRDKEGHAFDGAKSYRLHVPPNVPAKQFWSVTLYDADTRSIILNEQRRSQLGSREDLARNADGSVDIYFGPKVPASQESNWIYTQTEKSWFPWFRFYGPEKALFDKSWTMPDIEMVKQ